MDRFTWGIVAGVVLLVAAGIATAAVLGGRQTPPDLSTPSGVVLEYVAALQRGDPDRAWSLLASSTQARTTRDSFFLRAGGARPAQDARLSAENEQVQGDTATLDLVRTYPGGRGPFSFGSQPYSQRSPVRLVRENGQWRIGVPPDPYLVGPPPSPPK